MHYLFLFIYILQNVIAAKPTLVSKNSFLFFLIQFLETNLRLSLQPFLSAKKKLSTLRQLQQMRKTN